MYAKWLAFVPSPRIAFLVSTKLPTLTLFPKIVPGLILALGPKIVSSPIVEPSIIVPGKICVSSPIEESLIIALGPIFTLLPSVTSPSKRVLKSISTS